MTLLDNLTLGFGIVMMPPHLLLLIGGCILGVLAAAMPRLGVLALIAMALPVSHVLELTPAMILLVGIYCGACGGAASAALATAAGPEAGLPVRSMRPLQPCNTSAPVAMLIASLIGAAAIAVFAPWAIQLAFRFGPAEYFSMMVLGLVAIVVLAAGSFTKSLSMLVLGLLLAQIATEPLSGAARFKLDYLPFDAGIGLIPMALGLVVVGRIVSDLVAPPGMLQPPALAPPARLPWREQWRRHGLDTARGSAIGALFGNIPGGGILIGASVAGSAESRRLADVGTAAGSTPPVSAQAALVAGTRSSFIPLLALGVPANAALALMTGLMLHKDLQVGPQLMTGRADLFWALVAVITISGVVLFALGRPLGMLAGRLETFEISSLYPVIGVFCCVAAFALQGGFPEVVLMSLFAVLGHIFFKLGCPIAPLLMGFILGPTLEGNLRHALELSSGDWSVLVLRPISAGLLLAGALLVAAMLLPSVRLRRAALFGNDR